MLKKKINIQRSVSWLTNWSNYTSEHAPVLLKCFYSSAVWTVSHLKANVQGLLPNKYDWKAVLSSAEKKKKFGILSQWKPMVLTIRGDISMLATRITELSSASPRAATMLQNTSQKDKSQTERPRRAWQTDVKIDPKVILRAMTQSAWMYLHACTPPTD